MPSHSLQMVGVRSFLAHHFRPWIHFRQDSGTAVGSSSAAFFCSHWCGICYFTLHITAERQAH